MSTQAKPFSPSPQQQQQQQQMAQNMSRAASLCRLRNARHPDYVRAGQLTLCACVPGRKAISSGSPKTSKNSDKSQATQKWKKNEKEKQSEPDTGHQIWIPSPAGWLERAGWEEMAIIFHRQRQRLRLRLQKQSKCLFLFLILLAYDHCPAAARCARPQADDRRNRPRRDQVFPKRSLPDHSEIILGFFGGMKMKPYRDNQADSVKGTTSF